MALDKDMVWEESKDVYRPKHVDIFKLIDSMSLGKRPIIRTGQSFITIRRQAYATLRVHLQRDLKNEAGGLLIGAAFFDPHLKAYLITIEQSLAAEMADETELSIAFTAETWAQLLPEMQSLNPEWTILGSYHSHPGMGVFLSPTDLEMLAGIFPYQWQTALVVDPVTDEVGFFMGEKGTPCKNWVVIG